MRGKYSHKGKNRKFTSPKEIDRQLGINLEPDGESVSCDSSSSPVRNDTKKTDGFTSEEDSDGSNSLERHKGVSHLIKICNPNRHNSEAVIPSRKELEASARTTIDPIKLKSEEELARDLARLELVRKERLEAAAKLEKEKSIRQAQRAIALQRAEAKLQSSKLKGKHKSNKNNQATTKSTVLQKPEKSSMNNE